MAATYGDAAEFYVVYIKEAHAADGDRPVPIPDEDPIYEPKSLVERKAVAKKCVAKLNLEVPCLVDGIDNAVGEAYAAMPDRIFVVDMEGKIAVRGDPGPRGFKPGVDETARWLAKRFPDRANSASVQPEQGEG
ncbi:MAG: hypothetical protein IH987_16715 [Planctomycetes bacterium]|nr:hypothetical protein [Planctomycetota bacterium]